MEQEIEDVDVKQEAQSSEKEVIAESEKIELHSDDANEILGQVPHWLVRWGVTVFFFILIGIIAGSFIFKYPDVIESSVVILSENPPVSVIAHSGGKIDRLFVRNGQFVKQGETMAILENTAHYQDVVDLKNRLEQLSPLLSSGQVTPMPDLPNQYNLGTIQSLYSTFQRQYMEYRNYLTIDLNDKKIASTRQQITDYGHYMGRLNMQISNLKETLKLSHKQFKRDSILLVRHIISPADYDKSEETYLQMKNTYQSELSAFSNTQMQANQLKYQIIDLQSQTIDESRRLFNTLREAYDNLKIAIIDWERTYILSSSIDGKVVFINYWTSNQNVASGDEVFTVVPIKTHRIIGRVKLPIAGSGKVQTGQLVYIRLDNYPYTEFGVIEGRVESISLIPASTQQGTFYTVEISLPKGLITNYNRKLPFAQEQQGQAEIITKNQTLFDRLFNPFKSVVKKSTQ